uniref:Stabilin 2 n=1 Tax=Stegastes partitus TaxID=144197 RepID=A0A3B5B1Q3_9TELE
RQNFCSNSTVLRIRTACHSCSITMLIGCRSGFKPTCVSSLVVLLCCRYYIQTPSMQLGLSGCHFECYKEQEVKDCCPGYWGPDCMECPDRADRPCSGRGVCSDGLGGNGTCSCQVIRTGGHRSVLTVVFFFRSAVCSCSHGLCDSGLTGDGRCTCFSGYKGPTCEQELPSCAALSCGQNSRCMEEALTGQLVCQCLPGYQKSADQSINPCLRRVCHVHATCLHTGPNQHSCTCDPGYSGDGRVCMEVDPCQTHRGGCSAESARCVYDGPGKSHCECLPGFSSLSDGSCSLKDSCKPDSCHKNANCSTVEPGQVQSVVYRFPLSLCWMFREPDEDHLRLRKV